MTLSKDGRTAYVSNQGGDSVDIVDVGDAAPVVTGQITVGLHPNKSVITGDGTMLYVANGDEDSVSEVDLKTQKVTRTIALKPYKDAPVGKLLEVRDAAQAAQIKTLSIYTKPAQP